jgi:hypothetical protein
MEPNSKKINVATSFMLRQFRKLDFLNLFEISLPIFISRLGDSKKERIILL